MMEKEIQQWIEKRYGPVTFSTEIVASVPTYDGAAIGRGTTNEEALAALYVDLTGIQDVKGSLT